MPDGPLLGLSLSGWWLSDYCFVSGFGARKMAGFTRGETSQGDKTLLIPYPDMGTEPERLLTLLERMGAPIAGTHFEFPLRCEDIDELAASKIAPDLEPGKYICIHPGARKRDKCWPPERFAHVADQLRHEFGFDTVLTGSADEAPLARAVAEHMRTPVIEAAAPISIGAMAALMSRSRLLICNDTGYRTSRPDWAWTVWWYSTRRILPAGPRPTACATAASGILPPSARPWSYRSFAGSRYQAGAVREPGGV